ncbi:hypothetical protein CTI12_AA169900 [Artemisia annua]|uniref:RRM domain-containing protein n=1 Tax=Artemisia annua TaxID=35608 RepID=A0A2U1PC63_ARTAN|nr:hypothetical protein CTI12_AA169900 [Artemisia annua]
MKKNNKKDSSAVVTVNNLPFSAKEEDLSDLFEECGEFTVDFDVTKDGLFKGSAKLNFETSKQARKALELDGVEFFDREISVEMSASGAAGTKDAAEPLSVCVKGLPADIKHEELDKLFKHCGRKIRVKVPREAGKSHGYAHLLI